MTYTKLEELSPEQQQRLDKLCKDNVDFILHSGKDLTREEVEPYVRWLYRKIGKSKPVIKISDSFLAQQIAINTFNKKLREIQDWSQVWSDFRSHFDSQLRLRVGGLFWSQMISHVESQFSSHVESRIILPIKSQVRSYIRSQELNFVDSWCVFFNSSSSRVAEFLMSEGIIKDDNFDSYLKMKKCGIWSICYFKNAVFICKLPIKVLQDDRGRLHSVTQAAVQWRDGLNNHFIHGVGFERELWKKVVKRELTPQELLQIKNIDQRFAALNHYGFENVLEQLNSKLIDKSQRGNELYAIRFGRHMLKFLKYTDTVNGTPRVSFVKPEFNDADEAMAWKHNMTKEEYQNKLKVEA
jgi:hypothetical protein